jgi:uroporphyrin-III C-methyltransferase/precorrin-2 dehydrogenase/sirohydrochlorin ferrochelatase
MIDRQPAEVESARMAPLARLPVFYRLDGKRAVVAGGSPAAAWKAELLSAAGAHVFVYAADVSQDMIALAGRSPRGPVTIVARDWTADDLRDSAIAVGACDDHRAAHALVSAARRLGVPVNVIDRPEFCDFAFGSIVNRSPLVIGISTDGAAPVFAQAVRSKLEAFLPKGFAQWATAAAGWRPAVKVSGLSFAGRRRFWQLFTARAIANPDRPPGDNDFADLIADLRGAGDAAERGSVTLVGAGPGDPELLTLRAVRALQSADVILFDDLVSRDVLDFARREAKTILVGKTGYGPSCKQDDVNALMIKLARQGRRVVRLKGGDPLIFARAGEEIAACRNAGIDIEIVPGITAAQGAAARLGMPLTDRDGARRVQYVTGHARSGDLPDDIDWRSLADPAATTAVYMPKRTFAALAARAVAEGLDPATPAIAVARATYPDQTIVTGTALDLASKLNRADLAGPVLVFLGKACLAAGDHAALRVNLTPQIAALG